VSLFGFCSCMGIKPAVLQLWWPFASAAAACMLASSSCETGGGKISLPNPVEHARLAEAVVYKWEGSSGPCHCSCRPYTYSII
jgi:hypothetical protein